MNEVSPQSTDDMRYRSSSMIFGSLISLWMLVMGLFILAPTILLGDTESKTGDILFLILPLTLAGHRFLYTVIKVESSSDGLMLNYLLPKPKHIPWHDIHEVRLKQSREHLCVIEYGDDPVKRVSFIVDYVFPQGRERCNRLLTVIANNAQLKQGGKTKSGFPIYQREETSYE